MNAKQLHRDWDANYYYSNVHTAPGRRASDCIKNAENARAHVLKIFRFASCWPMLRPVPEKADGNDD